MRGNGRKDLIQFLLRMAICNILLFLIFRGSLWMGEGTHRISMELFAFNRERLVKRLRAKDNVPNKGMIFLQGGSEVKFYNTDTNYVFRQVSFSYFPLNKID